MARKLLILGGGTAGTLMLNKLSGALERDEWQITIVDATDRHYYQPGFLYIPFGIYTEKDVVKPRRRFFPDGTQFVLSAVHSIEPEKNRILLTSGVALDYDFLIVATGAGTRPEETEGMRDELWHREKFDFYTLEGAVALGRFLGSWRGGRLVVHVTEMPIKCPVAPLEFLFLADWYFTERGIRDKVELDYVTPLPGAFTRPAASAVLGDFLQRKKIGLTTEFNIARVDNENRKLVSWDETEVPYDVLVTVPTNKGADFIARSGLGDELNFIPTDKHTLRARDHENIFVLGDATNLPSSKAGSVAHFQGEILSENLLNAIEGRPLEARFDGHANCFIETGFGKGMLIDFNYNVEPLPGKFPLPGVGPFSLLRATRMNHYGKMMFRWAYWNLLLKGREMFIGPHMSMAGKQAPATGCVVGAG